MHQYLRAIGFSKYKNDRALRPILNRIIMDPVNMEMFHENDEIYGYFNQSFGDSFGLSLFVTYEDGAYKEEYFFPYAVTDVVSSGRSCTIEKRSDMNAYSGMCDEPAFGLSLIFFVTNGITYAKRLADGEAAIDHISLTALSLSGKILLPINKTAHQRELALATARERARLIEAAKDGDEDAMENLAMSDMNTADELSERVENEDLYSLVDNTFMPFGMESDKYSIIAEILEVKHTVNVLTNDRICFLLLDCSGVRMGLYINELDLLGEPAPGRRFKGDIWLQGCAHFK